MPYSGSSPWTANLSRTPHRKLSLKRRTHQESAVNRVLLTSLERLNRRDTQIQAAAEIEDLIEGAHPKDLPTVLAGLANTNASQTSFARKEAVRLIGVAAVRHEEHIGPYVGKCVEALCHRLKDGDIMVTDACAETMGLLVRHVRPANGLALGIYFRELFVSLNERLRPIQEGGAKCLNRVVLNAGAKEMEGTIPKLVPRVLRLVRHPNCLAVASLIGVLANISEISRVAILPFIPDIMQVLGRELLSSDWSVRKATAQALEAYALNLKDTMSVYKHDILEALQDCRFDKIRPVREAAAAALLACRDLPEEEEEGSAAPPPSHHKSAAFQAAGGRFQGKRSVEKAPERVDWSTKKARAPVSKRRKGERNPKYKQTPNMFLGESWVDSTWQVEDGEEGVGKDVEEEVVEEEVVEEIEEEEIVEKEALLEEEIVEKEALLEEEEMVKEKEPEEPKIVGETPLSDEEPPEPSMPPVPADELSRELFGEEEEETNKMEEQFQTNKIMEERFQTLEDRLDEWMSTQDEHRKDAEQQTQQVMEKEREEQHKTLEESMKELMNRHAQEMERTRQQHEQQLQLLTEKMMERMDSFCGEVHGTMKGFDERLGSVEAAVETWTRKLGMEYALGHLHMPPPKVQQASPVQIEEPTRKSPSSKSPKLERLAENKMATMYVDTADEIRRDPGTVVRRMQRTGPALNYVDDRNAQALLRLCVDLLQGGDEEVAIALAWIRQSLELNKVVNEEVWEKMQKGLRELSAEPNKIGVRAAKLSKALRRKRI